MSSPYNLYQYFRQKRKTISINKKINIGKDYCFLSHWDIYIDLNLGILTHSAHIYGIYSLSILIANLSLKNLFNTSLFSNPLITGDITFPSPSTNFVSKPSGVQSTRILTSIIARDPNNLEIPVREVINNLEEADPKYVGLKNPWFTFKSTLSKVAGAYMKLGLVAAMIHPEKEVSDLESVIRE